MASVDDGFKLEVSEDVIQVTFSGTTFAVAYRKPRDQSTLEPTGFSKEIDATPAQIGACLAAAYQLALEKARALGWIE